MIIPFWKPSFWGCFWRDRNLRILSQVRDNLMQPDNLIYMLVVIYPLIKFWKFLKTFENTSYLSVQRLKINPCSSSSFLSSSMLSSISSFGISRTSNFSSSTWPTPSVELTKKLGLNEFRSIKQLRSRW